MNPDEFLNEIRRFASDDFIEKHLGPEANPETIAFAYGQLAGRIEMLDNFLSRGGELPSAWSQSP